MILILRSRRAANGLIALLVALCASTPALAQRTYPEQLFAGCNNYQGWRSPQSTQRITLNFANRTKAPINISWIGFNGAITFYKNLAPSQSWGINSFTSHPWLITNPQGKCLGTFIAGGSQGVVINEPEDAARDWGHLNPTYDVVDTWSLDHAPTECFHHFDQYQNRGTVYYNVNIFCTAVVAFIGYDRKIGARGGAT